MSEIIKGKFGPVIKGTGVYVHNFVENLGLNRKNHLLNTWIDLAKKSFPQLSLKQIKEALKFYDDHKDEIDLLVEKENQED